MANKKRRERTQELYRAKLGRYRLTRRDILVIEKLLRIYADTYEKSRAERYGQATEPPKGRKTMPRRFADLHVNFNGERADSVKFLPKYIKRSRNFEIRCAPGLWIKFTPLTTTIGGQVAYATGVELKVMNEVVAKLGAYLENCDRAIINLCKLR